MSTTTSRTERKVSVRSHFIASVFAASSPECRVCTTLNQGVCTLNGTCRCFAGFLGPTCLGGRFSSFLLSGTNSFRSSDHGENRCHDFVGVGQHHRNHRRRSRRCAGDGRRRFDSILPLASPVETQLDVVDEPESSDHDDVELGRSSVRTDRRSRVVQRARLAPIVRRLVRQNDQLSPLRRTVNFCVFFEKRKKKSSSFD